MLESSGLRYNMYATKVEEDVTCKWKRTEKDMVKNKMHFVETLTEILAICYVSFHTPNVPWFLP